MTPESSETMALASHENRCHLFDAEGFGKGLAQKKQSVGPGLALSTKSISLVGVLKVLDHLIIHGPEPGKATENQDNPRRQRDSRIQLRAGALCAGLPGAGEATSLAGTQLEVLFPRLEGGGGRVPFSFLELAEHQGGSLSSMVGSAGYARATYSEYLYTGHEAQSAKDATTVSQSGT